MTNKIHQTSIIDPEAKIGIGVEVGPFCVVGPQVVLGDGCVLRSHVSITGNTTIGKNNQFFQFCSIGAEPQDLTYKGEDSKVEIGDNNVFREYVSIHRGTKKQNLLTKIGSNNFLMATCHLGHDVTLGNKCIIVNGVNLAGHVTVGDNCIISGGSNISQFVTIGRGCYIAGASGIDRDIPPFCTAMGNRAKLKGVNIIGLKRSGCQKSEISELVEFFRVMETSALSARAFVQHDELMADYKNNKLVEEVTQFIQKSEIGIPQFS